MLKSRSCHNYSGSYIERWRQAVGWKVLNNSRLDQRLIRLTLEVTFWIFTFPLTLFRVLVTGLHTGTRFGVLAIKADFQLFDSGQACCHPATANQYSGYKMHRLSAGEFNCIYLSISIYIQLNLPIYIYTFLDTVSQANVVSGNAMVSIYLFLRFLH